MPIYWLLRFIIIFPIGFALKFEIWFELANADALCVTSL
jgi:hypothetical protein